jgi:hypothetical protein
MGRKKKRAKPIFFATGLTAEDFRRIQREEFKQFKRIKLTTPNQ